MFVSDIALSILFLADANILPAIDALDNLKAKFRAIFKKKKQPTETKPEDTKPTAAEEAKPTETTSAPAAETTPAPTAATAPDTTLLDTAPAAPAPAAAAEPATEVSAPAAPAGMLKKKLKRISERHDLSYIEYGSDFFLR